MTDRSMEDKLSYLRAKDAESGCDLCHKPHYIAECRWLPKAQRWIAQEKREEEKQYSERRRPAKTEPKTSKAPPKSAKKNASRPYNSREYAA